MNPENKFTMRATTGASRFEELKTFFMREFDVPFTNEIGARQTRQGFPCPIAETPGYYPSSWFKKTIDENAMRHVAALFDNEIRKKAPADRRNRDVRKYVLERLWTCAYDKVAKRERRAEEERIAELDRRAEERKIRLLAARAQREAEDKAEAEEREEAQRAAQAAAAQAAADARFGSRKRRAVQQGGPGKREAALPEESEEQLCEMWAQEDKQFDPWGILAVDEDGKYITDWDGHQHTPEPKEEGEEAGEEEGEEAEDSWSESSEPPRSIAAEEYVFNGYRDSEPED